jgi:enamine deaminase RidA (YjgF/YER057c/UK114 family)
MAVACAPQPVRAALRLHRALVPGGPAAGIGGAGGTATLGGLGLGVRQSQGGFGALPLRVLGGAAPCLDAWFGANGVRSGSCGAVQWRHDGQWLHGVLDVPEVVAARCDLGTAAHQAYRDLFATLHETGFAHLQRVWNYLPHINTHELGMERYRQFNAGRQRAFIEAGHDAFEGAPAACAIGTGDDAERVLRVRFLAGLGAPLPVENPRQVPAYRYPSQYGPRSPSFSRAVLLQAGPGEVMLCVSGTASIVGHASLHAGDVRAQLRETVANLHAVVEAARARCHAPLHVADMVSTVYVRHAPDHAAVRSEFETALGPHSAAARGAVYLQADICRSELLIEIEGHVCAPGELPA